MSLFPGLTVERIVTAAFAIADADGLEALTIRGVAEALGSSPMSLYRHVPGKEQLIDLMIDEVVGEQDLAMLPSGNWPADLEVLAHAQRAAAMRHPWSVIAPARPLLGPQGLKRFETALSIFTTQDLPVDRRAWAVGCVDSYVRGAVISELAVLNEQTRTGLDLASWQKSVEPYMNRMLATGDFPMIDEYVRDAPPPDPWAAFQDGLDVVISGLRVALDKY
ncbi:MAG: TetR/AcrR family transcriptional regulator [Rhodococcus sp. (in: high G+C Gram-positive bacteria)]|uniref:TetR/AcrR family transcriptional regulator n=1 Tax=Rhodococcus sp. TaxID=1831 RepID=UPI002AD695DC|nr:TetR/AcrR family transcriptional regulator [Rhodococcus sp. (in: high G+C Gram-positive bacteria)]